jgi:recombination protein RecA
MLSKRRSSFKSVVADSVQESVDDILSKRQVNFFSSGSTLLDLALGGGYAVGRVINIYGAESSGKSLLALSAIRGYLEKYPDATVWYVDSEHTFNEEFADSVGIPPFDNQSRKIIDDVVTIQDFFDKMKEFHQLLRDDTEARGILVLDSLDSLQEEENQEKEKLSTGYRTGKAKIMSNDICPLIYKSAKEFGDRITYYIVSQARDNLRSTFVPMDTRSGGRAYRFAVSQLIHLKITGKLHKTYRGVRLVVGVTVDAVVEKNKVGPAWRKVHFPILFDSGVEDILSCTDYLESIKSNFDFKRITKATTKEEFESAVSDLKAKVRDEWVDIESGLKRESSLKRSFVFEEPASTFSNRGPS